MTQALTSKQVELLRDGLYALIRKIELERADEPESRLKIFRSREIADCIDLADRLRIADRVTL